MRSLLLLTLLFMLPATAAEAVAENIRRIRAGQPPEPIVDPKAGY